MVMDRVASLLVRATDLRRKIWASLPWGYRLATIFIAMDSGSIEAWARTMGSLMLRAGVEGLPDPGPKWKPEKPNVNDLPRGYMNDFGKKAYAYALKQMRNPDAANDALLEVMMQYLSGKITLKPVAAYSAMSFILTSIRNTITGLRRKKREVSDTSWDGEEETTLELVDEAFAMNPHWNENPRQFKELAEAFDHETWTKKVIPAMRSEHPDMPLFFELLGDGNSAVDIVMEGMLPHFDPKEYRTPAQTWNAKVQKVKKLLREIADRN